MSASTTTDRDADVSQATSTRDRENLDDWNWAFDARSSGAFQSYAGQHVVIHHRRVVATDADAQTAIRLAQQCTGAAVEEFAVLYVDDPEREGLLHVR